MTTPDDLSRREALAGIGGAGVIVATLGGIVFWHRRDQAAVRSDDDDTTVHPPGGDDPTSKSDAKPGLTENEIDLHVPKKDGERFNSNSVSFTHGAFHVCNRGKTDGDIWIDADGIENDRGEPAVRFYRDDDLGARIDAPARAVTLKPDSCMRIGLMTRTFGIPQDTTLLETVYVRTERPS